MVVRRNKVTNGAFSRVCDSILDPDKKVLIKHVPSTGILESNSIANEGDTMTAHQRSRSFTVGSIWLIAVVMSLPTNATGQLARENGEDDPVIVGGELGAIDAGADAGPEARNRDDIANMAAYQQAFSERPEHYDAIRRIYRNPTKTGVQHSLRNIRLRQEEIKDARDRWTKTIEGNVGVGAGFDKDVGHVEVEVGAGGEISISRDFDSADQALADVRRRHIEQDFRFREGMRQNADESEQIRRTVVEIERKRKDGEPLSPTEQNIASVIDEVKGENASFPSEFSTYQGILDASKVPSDIQARIEAAETPEEKEQILNEFVLNNIEITNNITVNIAPERKQELGLDELEETISNINRQLSDPDSELSEAQRGNLELQKNVFQRSAERISLREHKGRVQITNDYANAGYQAAILLLGNNPNLGKTYQAISAGVQIYDAVGTMAISGWSAGGIGVVLSGMNALGSLSGGGDDQIAEMLEAIIAKLDIIDEKLDSLLESEFRQQAKLTFIMQALQDLRNDIEVNFDELRERLAQGDVNEETRDRRDRQRGVIETLQSEATRSLGSFELKAGPLGEQLYHCIETDGIDACDPRLVSVFDNMVGDLNAIFRTATKVISSDERFQQDSYKFGDRSPDKVTIESFLLGTPTNDRVGGALVSMGRWINRSKVVKNGQEKIDVGNLRNLPHPSHLLDLVNLYSDVALHLPKSYGYQTETSHVLGLRAQVEKLERASGEMRGSLHLVSSVFSSELEKLVEIIDGSLAEHDSSEILDYYWSNLPIAGFVGGNNLVELNDKDRRVLKKTDEMEILYIRADVGLIERSINAFEFADVRDVGLLMGVFEQTSEKETPHHNNRRLSEFESSMRLTEMGKRAIIENIDDMGNTRTDLSCVIYKHNRVVNRARYEDFGKRDAVRIKDWKRLSPPHQYHSGPTPNCRNELPAFKKFLIDYLVHHRGALLKDVQTAKVLEKSIRDLLLVELSFQTFASGGYGECVDFGSEMQPFQDAVFFMRHANSLLTQIRKAKTLPEFLNIRGEIINSISLWNSIQTQLIEPKSLVCDVGLGGTEQMHELLQSLVDYH